MKKIIYILLVMIFVITSCNLDDSGVFHSIIDKQPTNNKNITAIGQVGDVLYFKSVNGIESYDFTTGNYRIISNKKEILDSDIFVIDSDQSILCFDTTGTPLDAKLKAAYLVNIDGTLNRLKVNDFDKAFSEQSFSLKDTYEKRLIYIETEKDKSDLIYKATINNDTIEFTEVPNNAAGKYYTSVNNIVVYIDNNNYSYYLNGDTLINFNPDDIKDYKLVSTCDNYLLFSNGSVTKVFELNTNNAKYYGKLDVGSVTSFPSFIYDDKLYFVFDCGDTLYSFDLDKKEPSAKSISYLNNVSIVGYYKYDTDKVKVCTRDNGFYDFDGSTIK